MNGGGYGILGSWPNVRVIPSNLPNRYSTLPLAKLRIRSANPRESLLANGEQAA